MAELTGGQTAGRGTSAVSAAGLPAGTVEVVLVRALLLGERLDTRALERDQPLGVAPLTVEMPGGSVAVLFRYGAVVLFGASTAALDTFVASLMPLVTVALPAPERDDARLLTRPESDQPVDLAGNIFLRKKTTERLQVIAGIFDGIEPLAATLREKGRAGARSKELLRHIGDVLLIQQKMVGRVETGEKPEQLWDHPELERLYVRLAEEYELRDGDHGKPRRVIRDDQPDAREGQAGRAGVAERLVVPRKPGNAGGGKGPWFKTDATSGEGPGDWAT